MGLLANQDELEIGKLYQLESTLDFYDDEFACFFADLAVLYPSRRDKFNEMEEFRLTQDYDTPLNEFLVLIIGKYKAYYPYTDEDPGILYIVPNISSKISIPSTTILYKAINMKTGNPIFFTKESLIGYHGDDQVIDFVELGK